MEKIRQLLVDDKVMTEMFIQSFIVHSCNIVILVVDMLSLYDQKLLERIKCLFTLHTQIIIIHNYFRLDSKESVVEKARTNLGGFGEQIHSEEVPYYIENNVVIDGT